MQGKQWNQVVLIEQRWARPYKVGGGNSSKLLLRQSLAEREQVCLRAACRRRWTERQRLSWASQILAHKPKSNGAKGAIPVSKKVIMLREAHNGNYVRDELGDDLKPTGRFFVEDSFGKIIDGPFDSSFDAECRCYLDTDQKHQWNFDQDT